MRRRRFLAAAGAAAFAGCSSPAGTTGTTGRTTRGTRGTTGGQDGVVAETLASGLTAPVSVIRDGDEFLVADQIGVVHRVTEKGLAGVALDVRERMVDLSGYTERGLLGVALRPDGGELFVRYSAPPREGTPDSYSHTFVLAAFPRDGDGFDREAERTVLEVPEPQSNHNAGDIGFGPDDYLYVGVGDGGGANDTGTGHVSDWYDGNAGGNGQEVEANLLGSVLRIDVTDVTGDRAYGVPSDNPLVGRAGLDEHYAWGFRNPWRFSFDRADLYVADVGQNRWEEVNRVDRGGNYGWNVREGAHCFRAERCPTETPGEKALVDPVVEYPHSGGAVSGLAVVGGYVYRGERISGWRGEYVFADWNAGGRVFVATPTDAGQWPVRAVPVEGLGPHVLGFGRNSAGELLACTSERTTPTGETGELVRFASV